jgi:hypothetical protein
VVSVSRVQEEIGLGPTMFMMMTKALATFFLLMTILNLPVMWLYYSANLEESSTGARILQSAEEDQAVGKSKLE